LGVTRQRLAPLRRDQPQLEKLHGRVPAGSADQEVRLRSPDRAAFCYFELVGRNTATGLAFFCCTTTSCAIVRILIAVAAVCATGCAKDVQRVEAVGPTVTLTLDSLPEFEQAQHRANHLCRSYHGYRAQLLRTEHGPEADLVTFACVPE
jgi:hypothetical protein